MKQNTNYTKEVFDHFQHPRNQGEIKNPDAEALVGNPSCGDILKVMLKIDDKTKEIKNIKFQTMGCAAAIATSSMLTVLAKGKTIEEAKKITPKDIEKALGKLPPIKVHCSNLGAQALHKAIDKYEKNLNRI